MKEVVDARYQLKDENNNVILDDEGKPTYFELSAEYDFGDDLDDSVEKFGSEVVHSNFRANAKVGVQGLMRSWSKAGLAQEQIQARLDNHKIGVTGEKVVVDPATAIQNAFATWPDEKKAEFLASLGVEV
jgi:hypothetical protein